MAAAFRQFVRHIIIAYIVFHTAHAYPDYLLTRSSCWTELNTDEVIMNFPVVSVAESDDPLMQITMKDDTVGVKTTNPKTDKDYQYVIDVIAGDCSFPNGGCDGNRRATGRSKDIVPIQIKGKCQLQAGWAAGHEAVRLTPVVEIGGAPTDTDSSGDADEEESDIDRNEQDEQTRLHEEIVHETIFEDPSQPDARALQRQYETHWFLYTIGFERVGISWSDYWLGAIVLLLSPIVTIFLCLKLTERSHQKRRDL